MQCAREQKGKRFQTRPLYLIIIVIINKCNYATRSRVLHNPEHCNYQMAFIRINAATMTLFVRGAFVPNEFVVRVWRASLAHHDAIIRMYPSEFGMAFGFEKQVHFATLQKRAEYWCTHRVHQKGQIEPFPKKRLHSVSGVVCPWRRTNSPSSLPHLSITQMCHLQNCVRSFVYLVFLFASIPNA